MALNISIDSDNSYSSDEEKNTFCLNSVSLSSENLNKPLCPSLSITKFETMLMIFHMTLRHGMTGALIEDILKFVNKIVCDDNALPCSKYLFQKLFSHGASMETQFYCPTCCIYLGPKRNFKDCDVTCPSCDYRSPTGSIKSETSFVSFSIRDQIKDVLQRSDVNINLNGHINVDNVIRDIYDGEIYQSLKREDICGNALTITFNTDGVNLFQCITGSLWSIFFTVNEIVPSQRFKPENVFLAGLWFGNTSPIMNVFFKPFVTELVDLTKSGIVWNCPGRGIIESTVYAICCVTDSVAKSKVQNIIQYNGAFGCGYCYHPNVPIVINNETRRTTLKYVPDKIYAYRSDKKMRKDMRRENVNLGVKGKSCIYNLPGFNMCFGFGIDYLHQSLEGVMNKLLSLWFDSSNHQQNYYIGTAIGQVDKRLCSITPPTYVSRKLRSLTDRARFKANELRNFLLYFLLYITHLPCLLNILPEVYYKHFQKLVTAVYIYLQEKITLHEADFADNLLYEFTIEYSRLYSEANIVYNIHLCMHLGKIVSMLGPLWAYSTFVFESGNGYLKRLVKGTTGIVTQVGHKYIMVQNASKLVRCGQYNVRNDVLEFCSDIFMYKQMKNCIFCNEYTLLGRKYTLQLTANERDLCNILSIRAISVDCYNRVIKSGIIYYGKRYSKQQQFNDSCVRLDCNNGYAYIDLIFLAYQNQSLDVFCFIRSIQLAEDRNPCLPPHIKQCSLDPFGPLQICKMSNILSKCILICCDGKKYISEPNTYERD